MSTPNDDDRTVVQPPGGGRSSGAPGAPGDAGAPGPAAASPAAPPVADHAGNALPPGTELGEFELTSVLGEGGFGIVYVAWDRSLQRKVALKEYMPTSLAARSGRTQVQVRSERHRETFELGLRSFINEARLLAQFDHPSLVKVYRFWEAHGTAYMVMPLYEGVTLKDKLRQMTQPPDEAWLLRLLAPLTEALAVIHAERCYHRDIAPDNIILLAGSERPLLLDFGAARRVIGDMTQALTVILKPGYAPVEQYAEVPEMKQGAWTDVYALAASMHFAMMGRTPPTSVSRLLDDKFVPLTQSAAGRYSERFLQALDRALKVRPNERTASIAELRADLGLPPLGEADAAPVTQPVPLAPPAPAPPRAATAFAATQVLGAGAADAPAAGASATRVATSEAAPPKRRTWLIGGLGVAAAVAAGAGYLALGGRGDARAPAPGKAPDVSAVSPPPMPAQTPATAAQAPATAAPAPAPAIVQPAPAPPVARTFEIRDEFRRVLEGQTAGFSVQASARKSPLKIGRDRLQFEVSSSREGFVQVLVLGPNGTLMLLFPNAQAGNNRIKAGQTLSLPQASWPLDVSEPAGQEEFLVIVSAQPRDYSELSREREYIFLKLPTGAAGTEALTRWTRSTPLLLGALKSCAVENCEDYGAASFSVEITR